MTAAYYSKFFFKRITGKYYMFMVKIEKLGLYGRIFLSQWPGSNLEGQCKDLHSWKYRVVSSSARLPNKTDSFNIYLDYFLLDLKAKIETNNNPALGCLSWDQVHGLVQQV